LVLLWLAFWTCAYVIKPQTSENAPSLPPALTLTTESVLITGTILAAPWIVKGFQSN
jgi:hypothetical protein